MRLIISGSAPLLAETQGVRERTGTSSERYMTEASMITSNPYQGGERIAGTVGFPISVGSQRGRELVPPNEVGVLGVKGPNVFKGTGGILRRPRSSVLTATSSPATLPPCPRMAG